MRFNHAVASLLAVSLVWVWSVYRFTINMQAMGTENAFLNRTYEWLFYMILSLVCFILFIVIAKHLPHKLVAVVGGAVCAVTLLFQILSPIGLSTDYYRYVWQGRVSNAGQSNYSLVPRSAGVEKANNMLFERMDWRDVRSVYPPLAEQYFRLPATLFNADVVKNTSFQTRLSFSKIPNLLLFALCGFLLYKITSRKLMGFLWLALPFLQFELVNSAHVDVLSIALILGALLALRSKYAAAHVLSGSLIAAAGMVKLTPFVLIVPIVAYLLVNYSLRRAAAAVVAFVAVIAVTVSPFIVDNFALSKRLGSWLNGGDFIGGNPLYELLKRVPFGYPAGTLKVVALLAGAAVIISIIRSIANKRLNYDMMLQYGLWLLLVPFIAAPIVLPWYWITPLAIVYLLQASSSRRINTKKLLLVGSVTGLVVVQYIDRALSTALTIRLIVVVATSLVLYGLCVLYVCYLASRQDPHPLQGGLS